MWSIIRAMSADVFPPERPTSSKVGSRLRLCVLVITTLAMTGCGSTEETTGQTEPTSEAGITAPSTTQTSASGETELFPEVIDASATQADDGTWTISATISSPYDSPDRYADAWRVVGPDGTVFGERILTHDHASEQPFTRSQNGITIPSHITVVTIEGRDQQSGWGGTTFELSLGDQ